MNRRSFFQRTVGAVVAAAAAPFLPVRALTFKGIPLVNDWGAPITVCGINRATYLFWRRQTATHDSATFKELEAKMLAAFNECHRANV